MNINNETVTMTIKLLLGHVINLNPHGAFIVIFNLGLSFAQFWSHAMTGFLPDSKSLRYGRYILATTQQATTKVQFIHFIIQYLSLVTLS